MRTMRFADAIDDALAQAMAEDPTIVVMGEDVPLLRRNLIARLGDDRFLATPISESAFVGAGVTAAMAGLRPVVELQMIDFVGVAADALLNHAAKVRALSGHTWPVPLVVRAPCGGGYGDGAQHEQSLWGWLAHIPGLTVVVPSTPADAGGLMLAALEHEDPVIYLEHKLLSAPWLDLLGRGGRDTVSFDVPADGAKGPVPDSWTAQPLGQAVVRREGTDLTLISVGVGIHRSLDAAGHLDGIGISASVVDLRTVSPVDRDTLCNAVSEADAVLVVDEDYEGFGLSGELAAVLLEAGIPARYARVCTETTIPYARHLESETLPNVERIVAAALQLMEG